MELVKVCAFALMGVLLALQFKGGKQEYGIYLGAALEVVVFSCTLSYMGQAKKQLMGLWQQLSGCLLYTSCSGVVSSRLSCISAAIFPIWVCKPTAQTIPVPRLSLIHISRHPAPLPQNLRRHPSVLQHPDR